ncbi:hypothetical protein DFR29_107293 [Tahibacter aquaticus]|uniref:Uncharacterized protein n=1 Tax=Tahibacter aquaticus TaxID=520092 RepID=A0A4R6YWQ7_9GAMM|nr:hypothetical protein [Tahibacter aquaticus]TDR43280.1 hypothetical protein DFR29_107293 [Tahibacter aquaticus]
MAALSHAASACFALVLALANPARAQQPFAPYSRNPELRIEALEGKIALRLQGNWPTPCLPSVETVSLDGNELNIELRSKRPLCARTPMPFDIEVDLAPKVGKRWPDMPLRVSVRTANSATAAAELRGFALIGKGDGPRPLPTAGLWWPLPLADATNPMAGTGFSLEVQGYTLAVAVLGKTRKGSPIWYFGTSKLRSRTTQIDLVAAGNGNPEEPTPDAAADSALLHMDFQGNGRATAWLGQYEQGETQPLLRLQVIELAHLPFADQTDGASWHGDWVLLGATPGQPRSARQLRLNANSFVAAANYRLSGDDGSMLSCEREPQLTRAAPPRRCRLTDAAGALIADFDSIDINRLDGFAPDRTPVQLLRVQKR